ncbi:MAG: 2-oxo acid dehydrogenase subunit E2 [Asgard group archaeon]|nr:2-oxo acid dehydrogenase subunit E2 [Asgard group archaeon]
MAKMTEQEKNRILPFSKGRKMLAEASRQSKRYGHIKGILEVDVTKPVEIMNMYRERTGERLSFTSWVIKCVAQAVSDYRVVQTFRLGRNRMIEFYDVDIKTNVEKETKDGMKIPIQYLVRKAQEKSFKEIHDEIRAAQKYKEEKRKDERKIKRQQNLIMSLPVLLRKIFWHNIMTNPHKVKKHLGTIGVTALGMFGQGLSGYALPNTPHSTTFAIGAIVKKPIYIDGEFQPRDILHLTLIFNHDVVDGGPAVRFSNHLSVLMKEAYALDEFIT